MLKASLKSLLSRKLRLVLSGTAVILAVMFMAGALVLNATLQRSFDNAYAGAYSGVDIEVTKPDDVIGQSIVDKVGGTGVVRANGARLIGDNGKVAPNGRAPRLGVNWTGRHELREGRGPQRDDEIAVNALTARKT